MIRIENRPQDFHFEASSEEQQLEYRKEVKFVLQQLGLREYDGSVPLTQPGFIINYDEEQLIERLWKAYYSITTPDPELPLANVVKKIIALRSQQPVPWIHFYFEDTKESLCFHKGYIHALAVESPLFRIYFSHQVKHIRGCDKRTFLEIIKLMSSKKEITERMVRKILPHAVHSQLGSLEERCEKTLITMINRTSNGLEECLELISWVEGIYASRGIPQSILEALKKRFYSLQPSETVFEAITELVQSLSIDLVKQPWVYQGLCWYLNSCYYLGVVKSSDKNWEIIRQFKPKEFVIRSDDDFNQFVQIPSLTHLTVSHWKGDGSNKLNDYASDLCGLTVLNIHRSGYFMWDLPKISRFLSGLKSLHIYSPYPNRDLFVFDLVLKRLPNLEELHIGGQYENPFSIQNGIKKYEFTQLMAVEELQSIPTYLRILKLEKVLFKREEMLEIIKIQSLEDIQLIDCECTTEWPEIDEVIAKRFEKDLS